jgi:hypothetical protein
MMTGYPNNHWALAFYFGPGKKCARCGYRFIPLVKYSARTHSRHASVSAAKERSHWKKGRTAAQKKTPDENEEKR